MKGTPFSILKHPFRKAAADAAVPVLLLLCSFLFSSVWILIMGKNPLAAYAALLDGAFGSSTAFVNTVKKSVPIAFASFSIIVSMKGNTFNIGAEGQLAMGAIGAALAGALIPGLPPFLHIAVCLLAGGLFGMAYICFPAVMHVRRGVDLLVILLLLNNVASYILQYFVLDLFKSDNALVPSSRGILKSAELPNLIGPPYRMTIAILFVLVTALTLQWYFSRTVAGYEMRAVGLNREAARYAGIPVRRYAGLALLASGALAGVGGALEVLGNYHCLYTDFSPGFGYDGIPVALLCGSNPVLAVIGSIAFGALRNGSLTMQARVGISNEIISVIQGSLILFVSSNYIVRYMLSRKAGKEEAHV